MTKTIVPLWIWVDDGDDVASTGAAASDNATALNTEAAVARTRGQCPPSPSPCPIRYDASSGLYHAYALDGTSVYGITPETCRAIRHLVDEHVRELQDDWRAELEQKRRPL